MNGLILQRRTLPASAISLWWTVLTSMEWARRNSPLNKLLFPGAGQESTYHPTGNFLYDEDDRATWRSQLCLFFQRLLATL